MIIWQPIQPLGSGGFGITYKAKEPSIGKLYAIKTLNHIMQKRDDFAEQQVKFINEALTIKGFDHFHILKVYQVLKKGDLFGVVMEYAEELTPNLLKFREDLVWWFNNLLILIFNNP
ncbi:protein kinase [Cronbergia sp. UHCC 0137]|uniref:protein kinase domain-containing protein n=1 Tax=Cronbergia sp. UHCC 0137 TaxID=3110239 RepID=UPI002B1F9556|nr:protein kinase [Cronbergia sp. UHCC 0137]MEA5619332.1 protein kinase [Cronbergia sp. UHCC 0137]